MNAHESERHETIVVGGGQAGLALGHLLANQITTSSSWRPTSASETTGDRAGIR